MSVSLYQRLKAAGVELSHYGADLYVRDCPEGRAIIAEHADEVTRKNSSTFTGDDGSGRWIELPFNYDPFWAAKAKGAVHNRLGKAPKP